MKTKLNNAKCTSLTFEAPICLASEEGKKGEFEIKAYTGAVVDRWWGKLAIDVNGMSPMTKKMPILKNHNEDQIVGFSNKTWKDGSFNVSGKFSKVTAAGKEVQALADEGFPWQASIRANPKKIMELERGAFHEVNGINLEGPAQVWLETEIQEVSFVPIGADSNTSASTFSKFEEQEAPKGAEHKPDIEEKTMLTIETLAKDAPDLLAKIQEDAKATGHAEGLAAGIDQERARVSELLKIEDADDTARAKAITEGLSVDASFRLFFEAEKSKKAEELKALEDGTPESAGQQGKEASTDDKKTFMQAVDEYQTEKKCTRTEALQAVAKDQPELHAASLKGGE